MSTLSGTKIKDTYSGLLKTTDNAALSGTLKAVTDGAGNASGLELSSSYMRATNGILFGTDTAAENILDDYEEGTYTPIISSATNLSGTLTGVGRYTKIGKLVTISVVVSGASITSASTETSFGVSLPFTAHATSHSSVGIASIIAGSGSNRFGAGAVTNGSSSVSETFVFFRGGEIANSGSVGWIRLSYQYESYL